MSVVAAALCLAVAMHRLLAPGRPAAAGPAVASLAAGFLLGTLLGASTGEARRAACTAELRTGDHATAVGTVASRVGAAGRHRIRLRLQAVELEARGRRCRVPALTARVSYGPPGTPDPTPGERVVVTGEWMRFQSGGSDWPRGVERQGLLTGAGTRLDDASPSGRSPDPLLGLRSRAARRLAGRLPPDVAPTGLALLLAERDEIEPDLRRRFVEAGLAHLLAISGMHVGLLAAGAAWLLGLRLGPRRRLPVAMVLVAGYVTLIGAPPAARRALVVLGGYTWARLRGWPSRPGELLGLALLVALATAPGSLLDPGLQLSFAGFAGVVAGGRLVATVGVGTRSRRRANVLRAAGAGAGAVIATTPITAFHFGQATPVSLLSHFAGGPLVGIGLGSLVAVVALPDAIAGPAVDVATGTLRALHAVADAFSRVPGGHRAVAAPTVGSWIAWTLILDAARRVVRRGAWRAGAVPTLLAAAVMLAGSPIAGAVRGPALLCTLSVGQGDAAVLRTSGGRWLVFDGGPAWGDWNAGRSIVQPFLRRHGARGVEVAVLSHAHLDHLGGLRGLLSEMRVERVADTGAPEPSRDYAAFLAEIDAAGARWLPTAAGDRLRVDDAVLTVLGPVPSGRSPEPAGGANASSLVFRLVLGGRFRYLNTGDATAVEEEALLAAWPAESLRAELLKVGHHGSRTSSTTRFLLAVDPDLAVISAGADNRYGHPHAEVLARLEGARIPRLWRTDRHGTLCVEIDREGRWRVRGETAWRTPRA